MLVVGGGDSAVEAALALADSGAKVMISYRGKGFNRAAPKNKQTIEALRRRGPHQGRSSARRCSSSIPSRVTLALADGSQKRYPNDGAFVLIGADPPVQWLEKMGMHFVERPHQYQIGKTDDIVRRFVARAAECPEDAARAAAQILGGSHRLSSRRRGGRAADADGRAGQRPAQVAALGDEHLLDEDRNVGPLPTAPRAAAGRAASKKLDGAGAALGVREAPASTHGHTHTGHGRRDQLTAGERTRILRMLRDEGGRMADEESQVLHRRAARAEVRLRLRRRGLRPPPPRAPMSRRSRRSSSVSSRRTRTARSARPPRRRRRSSRCRRARRPWPPPVPPAARARARRSRRRA